MGWGQACGARHTRWEGVAWGPVFAHMYSGVCTPLQLPVCRKAGGTCVCICMCVCRGPCVCAPGCVGVRVACMYGGCWGVHGRGCGLVYAHVCKAPCVCAFGACVGEGCMDVCAHLRCVWIRVACMFVRVQGCA